MLKRVLNISGLMAALALVAVVSGCGSDAKKATYKVGKVSVVDGQIFGANGFEQVLYSADGKFAYVKTNIGSLFRVDLKDGIQSFNKKENYTPLSMSNPDNDGSAGKAKLLFPEHLTDRKLFVTKNGLVVIIGGAGSGLAYFDNSATKPTLAWTNEAAHLQAGSLTAVRAFSEALAVIKDGEEYILVANRDDAQPFEVSAVKLEAGAKFTGLITLAAGFMTPGANVQAAKMVASGDKVFFAGDKGVAVMDVADVGTTKVVDPISADAAADKWLMNSTYDHGAGNGFDSFAGVDWVGHPGIKNGDPVKVVEHKGKIYIALRKAPAANLGSTYTGGIAVYDIASGKIAAPNAEAWLGKPSPVGNMVVVGDKLMTVYQNVLQEINEDGSLGKILASKTEMENNKLKAGRAVTADMEGKTFYDYSGAQNFAIAGFFAVGGDKLFFDANRVFLITYEEKPIEAK